MGDPTEGEPPLVLARGRFDEVRIEGLVRDQGGSVEDYKGSRLLVQEEKKLAVVFLEPGLVAIGGPALPSGRRSTPRRPAPASKATTK